MAFHRNYNFPMKNLLPAAFSFMLPGLGQVYQRRYAVASIVFCVFTAANFVPHGRYLLPLFALLSSFEAFRRSGPIEKEPRFRIYLFGSVGLIGFLGWMSFAATAFLPVGNTLQTHEEADGLAREARQCAKLLGRYPTGLHECPEHKAVSDPWGRPYRYQKTESGFEIRSLGPDGVLGSRDDYRFTYR